MPQSNSAGGAAAPPSTRQRTSNGGVSRAQNQNFVLTQLSLEKLGLMPGSKIVITGGVTNGKSGNTDLIKVKEI